jgi:hypothetical protein
MTMETMTERVVRGAALLDERMPGWEAKIDLDRLDLNSAWDCVLGQLYGQDDRNGYDRGKLMLDMSLPIAADHGFSQFGPGCPRTRALGDQDRDELLAINEAYRELTNTWRDLILSRRAAAVHMFVPGG